MNTHMILGWLKAQMMLAVSDLHIYKEEGVHPAMRRLTKVANMSLDEIQAEAEKVSTGVEVITASMERDIKRSRIVRVLARNTGSFSRINAEQTANEIIREIEK